MTATCRYFRTERGCRAGSKCRFSHEPSRGKGSGPTSAQGRNHPAAARSSRSTKANEVPGIRPPPGFEPSSTQTFLDAARGATSADAKQMSEVSTLVQLRLATRVAELRRENANLTEQNGRLQKTNGDLQDRVETELSELRARNEASRVELDALRESFAALTGENVNLRRRNGDLELEAAAAGRHCVALLHENDILRQTLSDAEHWEAKEGKENVSPELNSISKGKENLPKEDGRHTTRTKRLSALAPEWVGSA